LLNRIAEARVLWKSRKARALDDDMTERSLIKVTLPEDPQDGKVCPHVGLRVIPKLTLIKTGPKIEVNSLSMEFVPVESGSFIMGADDEDLQAQEYGKPAHKVVVSRRFSLARNPVTQGQWEAIMGYNPSYFKGELLPVENITWYQACEFIKRLNRKEGIDRHRLATEAEWEYAARAGEPNPFGEQLHSLDQYAWHNGNSQAMTHEVGLLKANPWGFKDMLGNIWEWVYDWFADYDQETSIDPIGPNEGSDKVVRGGSWGSAPWMCRVFSRSVKGPNGRSPLIGLRLVLDPDLRLREEFLSFAANK
jgi:formylglycine-generating enzyme required for sulfatase activity